MNKPAVKKLAEEMYTNVVFEDMSQEAAKKLVKEINAEYGHNAAEWIAGPDPDENADCVEVYGLSLEEAAVLSKYDYTMCINVVFEGMEPEQAHSLAEEINAEYGHNAAEWLAGPNPDENADCVEVYGLTQDEAADLFNKYTV